MDMTDRVANIVAEFIKEDADLLAEVSYLYDTEDFDPADLADVVFPAVLDSIAKDSPVYELITQLMEQTFEMSKIIEALHI